MGTENSKDMGQSTPYVALTTIAVVAVGTLVAFLLFKKRRGKSPNFVTKQLMGPVTLIDPETKYSLPLIAKKEVSHDTRRFIFGLPSKEHVLGLPTGQHVHVSAKVDDKLIVRSYTPVSSDDDLGELELVVKVYFKNSHPNFPDGGKMSQYLEGLNIGDTVDFRGPNGLIVYKGNGYFNIRPDKKTEPVLRHFHSLSLIAGGTGITPILQVIHDVLKNPNDPTKLSLLFANQSENDILLREELDELAAKNSDRFKVWYTVDRIADGNDWPYSVGYISADLISQHLDAATPADFKPNPEEVGCRDDFAGVFMCGPPPMLKFACHPALDSLNFPADCRFAF